MLSTDSIAVVSYPTVHHYVNARAMLLAALGCIIIVVI